MFMGTPDFAAPSLEALIEGPDNVVAVVCQPDKKKGRGKKLCAPPIKVLAAQSDLEVLQPSSIRTAEFFERVRELDLDLIVVAAYGKILPGELLDLPRLGTINVHGSILPKYRGAAPIQWAVLNGDKETGVTIMQMDEGMDTGDILLTASIPIGEDDTAGSMFTKLAELGGTALLKALALLKEGKLPPMKQDDALASEAPLLDKTMGHLDWNMTAEQLHNRIRGLDPWPSAYGFFAERRIRFFKPKIKPGKAEEVPGTIVRADKEGLLVATGEGYLLIRELQIEGKKRMDVAACLCGMDFPVGAAIS